MIDKLIKIVALVSSIVALASALGWHSSSIQAHDAGQERDGLKAYIHATHGVHNES